MTATRSPSVIASVWSWVTYIVVTSRSRWMRVISARISHAELRVEVRQRLVHQERARLAHDRAAHRDALPLTARERARLLPQHLLEPEHLRARLDAALDLGRWGRRAS